MALAMLQNLASKYATCGVQACKFPLAKMQPQYSTHSEASRPLIDLQVELTENEKVAQ